MNVVSALPAGDEVALIGPDGDVLRYSELSQRVSQMAGGLSQQGIQAGDRVVLLIPMSIQLYTVLLALFRLGATAVLVDPAADLQGILARYPVDALIGVPKAHLLRLKFAALRGLKFYGATGFTLLPHRRIDQLDGVPPEPDSGSHPALLTFTSGTTGAPKAIARSHDFLLGQHQVLSGHMPIGPGEVDLPTLPVFLLHSLAGGATCVIADADLRAVGAIDPEPVIAQVRTHGVSTTSGSPALFERIAARLKEQGETLPTIRNLYVGGARVPASLVSDLNQVLPNAQIHIVYGSTEAEPIAVLDANTHLDALLQSASDGRGTKVGTPVPDVQIQIDAHEPGQAGEILVAGPHVNPGYLDDPEADAAHKLHEGDTIWHRTGDVGHLDDEGALWLVGRVGEDVAGLWPLCAEAAAEQLAYVHRAGLVDMGGEPVLAVVLDNPPSNWSSEILETTGATPIQIDLIPMDPRHNAKVDRRLLLQHLLTRLDP